MVAFESSLSGVQTSKSPHLTDQAPSGIMKGCKSGAMGIPGLAFMAGATDVSFHLQDDPTCFVSV
jgi:hypothetical protein